VKNVIKNHISAFSSTFSCRGLYFGPKTIQGSSDISGIFYRFIKNDTTRLKIIQFY
jgi:hypothetical protein